MLLNEQLRKIPLLRIIIPFICGILCNSISEFPIPYILLLFIIFPVLLVLLNLRKHSKPDEISNFVFGIVMNIHFFFCGLIISEQREQAYKPIEKMSNKGIYVGFVEEFPEENKNFIQVLINIKFVKTNKSFTKFNQKLISYISDGTEIMNLEPGNKIIFNTSLIEINNNKNPGEFNIKSYYNSKKKL